MLWKLLIYAAVFSLFPDTNAFGKVVETDSSTTDLLPCEEGWVHFREKCYKIGGRELQDRVSWIEASDRCNMSGGHLVTIQSKKELDFVVSFLVLDIKLSVWIGLNKQVNEFEYHWHDGSAVNYTNWEKQPPPGAQDYEQCVEVVLEPYRDAIGVWNSTSCDRKNPYICQKLTEMRVENSTALLCDANEGGGWRFQNSCYHLVAQSKTWDKAEEHCRNEYNGHLVTILDVTVDYFLNYILSDWKGEVWIGIKTKDQLQQKWTSNWPVKYDAGKFTSRRDFSEGYCVLRSKPKEWRTTVCSRTYPFICETSTVLPPTLKQSVNGSRCPTDYDWRDFGGDFCYTVQVRYATRNWHLADSGCKSKGGDLLSIHSKEESDTLLSYIRFYPHTLFIGLFRMSENAKNFAWSDGSDLRYTNWDINEPSSNGGKCVAVREWLNGSKWYTVDCESPGFFICSIPKDSFISTSTETAKTTGMSHSQTKNTDSFNSTSTKTSKNAGQISVTTLISVIFCTILLIVLIGVIIFFYFCYPKRRKRAMGDLEPPPNSEENPRYRTQAENDLVENDLYESMSVTPQVQVK